TGGGLSHATKRRLTGPAAKGVVDADRTPGGSMRWKKTFTVVGCHAEGEVGNVVVGGVVDVPGSTMFEKKEYLEHSMDDLRQILLFEPRGAPYVNANIILPPCDRTADLGYVIVESTEYPP